MLARTYVYVYPVGVVVAGVRATRGRRVRGADGRAVMSVRRRRRPVARDIEFHTPDNTMSINARYTHVFFLSDAPCGSRVIAVNTCTGRHADRSSRAGALLTRAAYSPTPPRSTPVIYRLHAYGSRRSPGGNAFDRPFTGLYGHATYLLTTDDVNTTRHTGSENMNTRSV